MFKVALKNSSPQEVKVGDPVELVLLGDFVVDTALIAPSESRVLGHIDSLKPLEFWKVFGSKNSF